MDKKQRAATPPHPAHPADPVNPPGDAPPKTPNDIPGLGPIRIRALQKAGLGDLAGLRSASLEQLMAVRGMSEIKARHIQSYLAQFPAGSFTSAAASAPENTREQPAGPQRGEAQASEQMNYVLNRAVALPESQSPLLEEGSRALNLTLQLVMSDPAPAYRGRLLRAMARFLNRIRKVLLAPVPAGKAQKRVLRSLRSLLTALAAAVKQPDLDRKAQARLADIFAEINDRLATLSGQDRLSRAREEADE